jgi:hypothetical protein
MGRVVPYSGTRRVGAGVAIAVLALATSLSPASTPAADDLTPPGQVAEKPQPSANEASERRSARNGIKFGVVLTGLYDDNIFATPTNETHDFVSILSPYFDAKLAGRRGDLALSGGIDLWRYATQDQEDVDDYWLDLSGQGRVSDRVGLFGGLTWDSNHEERASPDDVNGIEPTRFKQTDAYAGVHTRAGPIAIRTGATASILDFDDVPAATGIVNNDDRDRTVQSLGVRATMPLSDGYGAFLQGTYEWRDYEDPLDDGVFSRDSEGQAFAAGVELIRSGGARGEAFIGHLRQRYDDPRFDELQAPDFGARISLPVPDSGVTLKAVADRTLEETTLRDTPGYLYTRVGVGAEYRPRPGLLIEIEAERGYNEYPQIDREDTLTQVEAGMRYDIGPHLFVRTDYSFLHRHSEVDVANYYRNLFMLRLGVDSAARSRTPDKAPPSNGEIPAPFRHAYLGGYLGHDVLYTSLTGPRGPMETGTQLDADYGDDGHAFGVVAGTGVLRGRWYVGIEADARLTDARWTFQRLPDRRDIAVEAEQGHEFAARIGRMIGDAGLLFVRVGGAWLDLETHYAFDDVSVRRNETVSGLLLGAGAQVPVGAGMDLLFDYGFADFEEYGIDYGSVDRFDPSSARVRLGLVATLSRPGTRAFQPRDAGEFAGTYAGVGLGHGSLRTIAEGGRGPKDEGGLEVADHAGPGPVWAGFWGAGTVVNNWYAGLELGAEAGKTDWQFLREVNVRDVTLDKRAAVTLAGRLGYVPRKGVLLFSSFGSVHTTFSTHAEDPNGSVVDADYQQAGLRLGLGLELQRDDRTFIRLDYSHTDYDTIVSNPERPQGFDPAEEDFRLSIGRRF